MSSTSSSASCAASSRPAARRGWCTQSAGSASRSRTAPVADARGWSLRSRVAVAAALGAVVVAVVVAAVVSALLTHREVGALDKRLDSVLAVVGRRLDAGGDVQQLLAAPLRRGLLRATV